MRSSSALSGITWLPRATRLLSGHSRSKLRSNTPSPWTSSRISRSLHYLTLEDVAEINERFVGPDGLAHIGLLESAILMPQTSVLGQDAYGTIHDKAGAVLHSLARND